MWVAMVSLPRQTVLLTEKHFWTACLLVKSNRMKYLYSVKRLNAASASCKALWVIQRSLKEDTYREENFPWAPIRVKFNARKFASILSPLQSGKKQIAMRDANDHDDNNSHYRHNMLWKSLFIPLSTLLSFPLTSWLLFPELPSCCAGPLSLSLVLVIKWFWEREETGLNRLRSPVWPWPKWRLPWRRAGKNSSRRMVH